MIQEKNLIEYIKTIKGNVLGIGITETKVLAAIKNNTNITECNLLNANQFMHGSNGKVKSRKNQFDIKKLRKRFKKKRIDYIICNIRDVKPYMRTFIKDSVYINRGMLYLYGDLEICDLDDILKKYQRYHVKIKTEIDQKNFVAYIDHTNAKSKKWKDLVYSCIDFIDLVISLIGDILIN